MSFVVGLCFLGFCFLLTRITRFAIETTPFFTVASLLVFLYVFAYFNYLSLAADLILLLGISGFIYSLVYFCRHRSVVLTHYLTPGLVILCGYLLVLGFWVSGLHFTAWDELSHWGPHTRILFLNRGFESVTDVVGHKAYPPGGRLFYYLFFHINGYSEGGAYIAQLFFLLCPLTVLLKDIAWKDAGKAFLIFTLALFVLLYFKVDLGPRASIYMDSPVAIFWGMSFVHYLFSRRRPLDILYLSPIVFALMLFKLKLMALVLLLFCVISADQCMSAICYFRSGKVVCAKTICKTLAALLFLLLAAYVAQKTWLMYLNTLHVDLEWKAHLSLSQVMAIFSDHTQRTQLTVENFLAALSQYQLFLSVLVCIILGVFLLYRDKCFKWRWLLMHASLALGLCLYLLGLLFLYLHTFDEFEGVHITSFSRYTGIFFIAWSLLVYAGVVDIIKPLQQKSLHYLCRILIVLTLAAMVFMAHQHHVRLTRKQIEHRTVEQLRTQIQKISDRVKATVPQGSTIFVIWQNSSGFEKRIFMYELLPLKATQEASSVGAPYFKGDVWTTDLSPQTFKQMLIGYDYLLLAYTDEPFWQRYGKLFPPDLKPLLSYSLCQTKGFDGVLAKGCVLTAQPVYLLRVSDLVG